MNLIKNNVIREIISWCLYLGGAVLIAFVISRYIIVHAQVVSGSMESTIMTYDKVIGFRLAYVLSEPQRGDIIMFHPPDGVTPRRSELTDYNNGTIEENETDVPYVKRIIGLPGDTIDIKDGLVYINGAEEPYDESAYLRVTPIRSFGPFEVPEDMYFVMGDNRNNSSDSRHWRNTFVPRESIISRIFVRIYPNPSLLR